MARPQTASDEEVLQAAGRVITRRGYDAFTLSEVAAEVGLSRAAIILRFKSTQELKIRLTTELVERFNAALATLPVARSGDGLLAFIAFIGGMIAGRSRLSSFLSMHRANLQDGALAALERARGEAMREAISQRMPRTALAHDSAVLAFSAHLSGSIMAWEAHGKGDARSYLLARTKEWLTLAQIPYANRLVDAGPNPSLAPRRKRGV